MSGKTDQTACKPGSVPLLRRSSEGGGHSSRPRIAARLARPTRTARAGDGPTLARAKARRPYLVLLQAGLAMPSLSPGPRCALTAPFHPCPASPRGALKGGLLSVALSLGSRPAGVTRRLVAVEPGLSSSPRAETRPPGRLIRGENGPDARHGQLRTKLTPRWNRGRMGALRCTAGMPTERGWGWCGRSWSGDGRR